MSESQEETPDVQGQQLLADMQATALMRPLSPERGANVYAEWRRSQQVIADLMAYQQGTLLELRVHTGLVANLLNAFSASFSNGSAHWTSELPGGRAPGFRRALNALVKHIRRFAMEPRGRVSRSTNQAMPSSACSVRRWMASVPSRAC